MVKRTFKAELAKFIEEFFAPAAEVLPAVHEQLQRAEESALLLRAEIISTELELAVMDQGTRAGSAMRRMAQGTDQQLRAQERRLSTELEALEVRAGEHAQQLRTNVERERQRALQADLNCTAAVAATRRLRNTSSRVDGLRQTVERISSQTVELTQRVRDLEARQQQGNP